MDYYRLIKAGRRFIVAVSGAAFVITAIISLLLPKIYASNTSLMPPQQEASMSSVIAARLPGGLAGLAGNLMDSDSPAAIWVAILKSRSVRGAIVDRFDLEAVLEAESRQEAVISVGGMVRIKKTKEGIIRISVESRDPELSANMAAAYVEELDHLNRRRVMSAGQRKRVFVEKRLKEAKVELAAAEDALIDFQRKNNAIELDVQSAAIIEAIGKLKGELIAKEVELSTLLSYATSQNPHVGIVKAERDGLRQKLMELQRGTSKSITGGSGDVFIPTSMLPALALKYARLFRDAKIQQTLYKLLVEQFEMARVQEATDTPTVQVLDEAEVPIERIRPKRRQMVTLWTLTAAFGAVFYILSLDFIGRLRAEDEA